MHAFTLERCNCRAQREYLRELESLDVFFPLIFGVSFTRTMEISRYCSINVSRQLCLMVTVCYTITYTDKKMSVRKVEFEVFSFYLVNKMLVKISFTVTYIFITSQHKSARNVTLMI